MKQTSLFLLFITSTIASKVHHSNEASEEHKSGYGVLDQSSEFGHDKESVNLQKQHKADSHLFEHAQKHENDNKSANSGSTKHIDEASNRGKDLKRKKYGFFDYHYTEPRYHLEKFFTNEKSARKFDEGEHNKKMERHRNNKENGEKEDHHQFEEKDNVENFNKFDQSSNAHHGQKDLLNEHHNLMDRNEYKNSEDNQQHHDPFKNGHYVPLFAPY